MEVVGEETTSSPTNRIKFLCSHGGKILPRPSDGHLKYVGGETRVVAVPRISTFSELMQKLTSLFNGDIVLKYQLIPEDLDALVSVTCDEDLHHMIDEYDRHEAKSSGNGSTTPRLRAFLFPSNPVLLETQVATNTADPHALEQRYIDAINGIIRTTNRSIFTISPLSSPKSKSNPTEASPTDIGPHDWISSSNGVKPRIEELQRVRSSPSILSTGHYYNNNHQHFSSSNNNNNHHHLRLHGQSRGGSGRLPPPLVAGVMRLQIPSRYYSPVRQHRRSCGCVGYGHVDECGVHKNAGFGEGENRFLLHSPTK